MANNTTTFSNACLILAQLWQDYRDEEQFQDFISYNDLGLPLAYAVTAELISIGEDDPAVDIIDESFDLLLNGLAVEDTGFESLEEILEIAIKNSPDN